MDSELILGNLHNPTLLFFVLGIVAALVRSDLEIPPPISRFLSLYLLFSIGFKGGVELTHSGFTREVFASLGASVVLSLVTPLYAFALLRRRLSVANAGAIAAAYGSVSAVTFVTASAFLADRGVAQGGHMVACMALMESPAIIVGVTLVRRFTAEKNGAHSVRDLLREALTNGSVLLILGSLLIGMVSDARQAEGIKPFTSDIFKGFLALFLLDMGMLSARRIGAFRTAGKFLLAMGIVLPLIGAVLAALLCRLLALPLGDAFLLTTMAATASYIAVPAALRMAVPEADPGLYIPMALAVTFPFNVVFGIPLYFQAVRLLCGP
jgi:hypothetical protein